MKQHARCVPDRESQGWSAATHGNQACWLSCIMRVSQASPKPIVLCQDDLRLFLLASVAPYRTSPAVHAASDRRSGRCGHPTAPQEILLAEVPCLWVGAHVGCGVRAW